MQYQALYRKYRPQRFDEVVGQDHVTATLAREVVDDKVAHAYLFTGPRGTGKTTSARLLAKSLNCTDRQPNGEPCNICASCVGITEGTSLDVIELDAASHNKVEDVREIRVNVGTVAAAPGARRVYILDEAHMLSRAASNALLKTLEEPPEHVVFVLATTEPYKLLDTIRSRTQRFDFQPVASEILIDYLGEIADKEGFTYDHGALGAVTSHAGGSVRDAMSLLEQVAALGSGAVTTAGVSHALGLADADSFAKLLEATHNGDAAAALTLVADLAAKGTDLRRFVGDTIGYLRGVFLTQYTDNIEDVVDAPRETIDRWSRQGELLASGEVLRAIDTFSDALLQLREGREDRLVLEIAVLRLARPETTPDLEGVSTRIDRLERDLRDLKRAAPAQPAAPTPPSTPEDTSDTERPFASPEPSLSPAAAQPAADEPTSTPQTSTPSPEPTPEAQDAPAEPAVEEPAPAPSGEPVTLEAFERAWPAMVAKIRQDVGPRRHALLREAKPAAVEGSAVVFEVAAHMHFHLEQLKADTELAAEIVSAARDQLGRDIRVVYRSADGETVTDDDLQPIPDKSELVAAEDADNDPTKTVLDLLGGEVVEDGSPGSH